MRHLVAVLCVSALMSACGSNSGGPATSTNPSAVPSSDTPASSPTPINVGEEVNGMLEVHGVSYVYELTAPSSGTLTARLSWDAKQGSLELSLADTLFPSKSPPTVGTLVVAAGQKYRVKVADAAKWDYDDLKLSFRLTTSIK